MSFRSHVEYLAQMLPRCVRYGSQRSQGGGQRTRILLAIAVAWAASHSCSAHHLLPVLLLTVTAPYVNARAEQKRFYLVHEVVGFLRYDTPVHVEGSHLFRIRFLPGKHVCRYATVARELTRLPGRAPPALRG